MKEKEITIYTDGACLGNPGAGGYAAILLSGNARKEISQGFRLTTNNRMEILAVIMALKALKNPTEYSIHIYTDSNLIVQAFNNHWINSWKANNWRKSNKEAVLNPDLWMELDKWVQKYKPVFHHVKGHSGILENENCDKLCKNAAMSDDLLIDLIYENNTRGIKANEQQIL